MMGDHRATCDREKRLRRVERKRSESGASGRAANKDNSF